MTASHAGFIFLQCPHQGARNLIKTVLPSVMSSQLRGVGERVTSYIRKRGDAGAALVGSELDGRGRTEQRERDEQFHRPARALSSVRGRTAQAGEAFQPQPRWTLGGAAEWPWLLPRFSACCAAVGGTGTVPTVRYLWYRSRERNLLALPTLDMYLPLSKFESIHRVSIAPRCNNNML